LLSTSSRQPVATNDAPSLWPPADVSGARLWRDAPRLNAEAPLPSSPRQENHVSRPVSRVLSGGEPPRRPFIWGAHCWTPRATNPGCGVDHARRNGEPLRHAAPIRFCSRWGLPCHLCCQRRGALLPHPFTLAAAGEPASAVCFLWHFPWGCPRRPLAATVDPWSPDFPPPVRSLAAPGSDRPAG